MFIHHSTTINLLILTYGASIAWSLPAEVARGIPRPATVVPCDPISKYTTEFFEGKMVYAPPTDGALFYTKGLTLAAQFASEMPGKGHSPYYTTIWDLFPCDLYKPDIRPYDPDKDLENPRRCIFTPVKNAAGKLDQSPDELTYFENMSRAMALWSDGIATVMNIDDVDLEGGVWGRVEAPTLKQRGNPGGTVTKIVKVDRNLENSQEIWPKKPSAETVEMAHWSNTTSTITKRTPPRGKPQVHCFSPEQIAAIDLTPW